MVAYRERMPCVSHLAALTGDAAVMVASGLVSTHHTRFILFQIAGDVPCNTQREVEKERV